MWGWIRHWLKPWMPARSRTNALTTKKSAIGFDKPMGWTGHQRRNRLVFLPNRAMKKPARVASSAGRGMPTTKGILGFFAYPPGKVHSKDSAIGMSSGVTETGQYWNDYMYLKFQAFTLPRHEHFNRLSLASTRAHAQTVGSLCLISGLMIRFSNSRINSEISVLYGTVLMVMLEAYC